MTSTLPTHLATKRLRLRPPALSDAEAIFARYAQDPDVTHFLLWAPHKDIEATRAFLTLIGQPKAPGDHTTIWVITQEDDTAIGMIGAHQRSPFAMEIGYVLAPSHRGQGLMPEAARAVVDAALAVPAIFRVVATSHIDNTASVRVQEKAGMQYEGLLRRARVFPNIGPEPCDERIYSAVKP